MNCCVCTYVCVCVCVRVYVCACVYVCVFKPLRVSSPMLRHVHSQLRRVWSEGDARDRARADERASRFKER